jgi:GNAT superfamily N-acetyltransferase
MSVLVRQLTGPDLAASLPDIAALRMEVFREWPYLYDGDLAYEERYLRPLLHSAGACVIGAFDGTRLVGAATATPLAEHADDFAAAFEHSDMIMADLYYCAESVLLPAWRGQGIGHRFFDFREDAARSLGFSQVCFASVIRPEDHPARPAAFRPLDAFWRGRGYAPLPGVTATFSWKDLGEAQETRKPLQFWHRRL